MGRLAEIIASRQGQENEIDLERRMATAARELIQLQQGGLEQILASVFGFTQADAYVDFTGDAGALGATLRLYAVSATGARTVEASLVVASVANPVRVSAGGRGCHSWDLTFQKGPGTPPQAQLYSVDLTSFDGTITTATVTPGGGGGATPGVPGFLDFYGSSGVIKASAGHLESIFASFDGGAAVRWLQVFDAAAVPVNGTRPTLNGIVGPNGIVSFSLTDPADPSATPGRAYATGIVWAISSTAAALTIDLGSSFAVTAKFL